MKQPAILVAVLSLASFPAVLHAQMGGGGSAMPTPRIGSSQDTNPLGVQQTGLGSSRAKNPNSSADQSQPPASGGGMSQFKSIDIPPVPDAPFTATVVTEWKRFLSDGSTQTTKSHHLIARDSSGRIFQEWRSLTPNGDKKETDLLSTEYTDPTRHAFYRCNLQFKMCQAIPYTAPSASIPNGTVKTANLGQKKIANLDTTGSRQTITPNAATGGDKQTIDAWFSPKLQINLMEKRAGSDILDFTVENLNLSEPDPKLFALPGGYRVVVAAK
jgi:hypothetical protein